MKKYYCPITNEQFNQIINFGQIFVPQSLIVANSDDFELVQLNLVKTFIEYIQFKYDEDYLVLKVFADFNTEEKTIRLNICNVEGIFPISDECYKAVTFKHPKIEFSEPIFSAELLSKINDAFFLSDSKNGIDCLMSIFQSEFESHQPNKNEIIQSAAKFRKRTKLNNLQPDSSIIDFVFLYVYQAYYPLTTLGYLYRTAEILTRKALLNKGLSFSHEILEKTEIYKLLEKIKIDKPKCNLQEIIVILEKDENAKKFIDNLSDLDIKYFIVIPMFLKIIDEFNDNNQDLGKTSLENLIKQYGPLYKIECQQLVLWLGAYLGYGNCYDYFYLKSNLKIFKSYKPMAPIQEDKIIRELATTSKEEKIENLQRVNEEVKSESKNFKGNSLEVFEIINESLNAKTENIANRDEEQNLEVKTQELTRENEVLENLANIPPKNEISDKLNLFDKYSIQESEGVSQNAFELSKLTEIEKTEKDVFEKYRNIIEDLLNQQTEVKLTEISSNIKKHFSNEKKSVIEIKEIIRSLEIEVQTVKGKTNTIKKYTTRFS